MACQGLVAAVAAPPPSDPEALSFVALDTRTPYLLEFDAADGGPPLTRRRGRPFFARSVDAKRWRRVKGQNAHYLLRWPALDATARCQGVSTRGEKGPWSETATATVGA